MHFNYNQNVMRMNKLQNTLLNLLLFIFKLFSCTKLPTYVGSTVNLFSDTSSVRRFLDSVWRPSGNYKTHQPVIITKYVMYAIWPAQCQTGNTFPATQHFYHMALCKLQCSWHRHVWTPNRSCYSTWQWDSQESNQWPLAHKSDELPIQHGVAPKHY